MTKEEENYLLNENERLTKKIEAQKQKIAIMEEINRKMFLQLQDVSMRMHNYEDEFHNLLSAEWNS